MFDPKYDGLGQQEGVGLLLLLGSLEAHGTGSLTAADEELFLQRAVAFMEDVVGYFNNAVVVATLSMAVAIPTGLYALTGGFDPDDPSISSGAFSWWPSSSDALYALHWVEAVCIALSIYNSTRAICFCFALVPAASFYLPDVEWRLRFFLDHIRMNVEVPTRLALLTLSCPHCAPHRHSLRLSSVQVWTNVFFSILFLLLALPFLAARVSPVFSLCAAFPFLALFKIFFKDMILGMGKPIARIQHGCARRLLTKPLSTAPRGRPPESARLPEAVATAWVDPRVIS